MVRCLVNPVTLCGSHGVFFVAASRETLDGRRQGSAVAAGRAAETQVVLPDAASDDLATMDAWEPERPSASKLAFARGFVCRYVQDSANPRASPGGTPEAWDADLTATLVREAFEENQVRVGATAYSATRRSTALAVLRTLRCGWRG